MIKLIQKVKQTEPTEPYYTLTYEYMIGDADGDTTEELIISKDNPYIEKYCRILDKLGPTPGYWGLSLQTGRVAKCLKAGQIDEEEYQFLLRTMFGDRSSTFVVEEGNENYADDFAEGVSSETEYSFLSFTGYTLLYVDEFGEEHGTYFE